MPKGVEQIPGSVRATLGDREGRGAETVGEGVTMRATLYPRWAKKIEGLGRRGEVLAGIWAGKGTKEIAAELGISPKTVEYHRARLYQVFGVNDLVSLCRRAIAVGLIDPKLADRERRKGEKRSQCSWWRKGCLRQCRRECVTHCRRICESMRSQNSQRGRSKRASHGNAKNLGI